MFGYSAAVGCTDVSETVTRERVILEHQTVELHPSVPAQVNTVKFRQFD